MGAQILANYYKKIFFSLEDRIVLDTGKKVVDRIITELGVFDVENDGLYLVDKSPKVDVEEIMAKTEANLSLNKL